MRLLILISAAGLAGCMTSAITRMDGDTYMVSKTSAGGGMVTAAGPTADVYEAANKYCDEKGMVVETVNLIAQNGVPFRAANARLQFRCKKAG